MDQEGFRVVFVGHEKQPSLLTEACKVPEASDGDILARICMATICGSDLHTIQGRRQEPTPSILGHEAVAVVVDNKRQDSSFKPGDRITFTVADHCNTCERCRKDLPNKCLRLFKYGHAILSDGTGFNGCYASHIVIRPGTNVVHIPAHVTDKMAAPINCALATMINATRAIPNDGHHTDIGVIQGAGMLGLYGCALLREMGFSQVYCTDINTSRLSLVSDFGGTPIPAGSASCFFLPSVRSNSRPIKDSVDVVIEACGAKSAVAEAINLLRPGGVYILVGMVHPDSQLNVTGEVIIRKCLTLKGIHNYGPKDLVDAVDFIARTSTKYPYEKLVGTEFHLSDIQNALKTAESQRFCRVALVP